MIPRTRTRCACDMQCPLDASPRVRPIANRVAPFELPPDSYFAAVKDLFDQIEGIDQATFQAAAEKAKTICPVSGLLTPGLEELTLNARLAS